MKVFLVDFLIEEADHDELYVCAFDIDDVEDAALTYNEAFHDPGVSMRVTRIQETGILYDDPILDQLDVITVRKREESEAE